MTLDEAARIQVPYVVEPASPAQEVRNSAFMVVAPAAVGVAAITSVWNMWSNSDGHRRGVSWSGVASGVLAGAAGTFLMTRSSAAEGAVAVGATSAVIGGLSILASSHSIYRRHQIVSAERDAERKRAVAEARVSPIVSGLGGSQTAVGASVSLRF